MNNKKEPGSDAGLISLKEKQTQKDRSKTKEEIRAEVEAFFEKLSLEYIASVF